MVQILDSLPEREIVSAKGRVCRLKTNRVCDGGFIYDISLPYQWVEGWDDLESDSAAGEFAERIFEQCVDSRLFQIPAKARRLNTKAEQYTGRDYVVQPMAASLSVEVKADFVGGEWGTGNLFVQTHEYRHQWAGRNTHRQAGAA